MHTMGKDLFTAKNIREKENLPPLYPQLDKENIVSSFFYYMWNCWNKEECEIVFGSLAEHFWIKWCEFNASSAHGSAEHFYAELTTYTRTLLVNRACEIYNGEERRILSEIDKQVYRCEKCGSTDVQIQAWVDPNHDNRFISDQEDYENSWCESCQIHGPIISHKEFMEQVEEWWNEEATDEDYEVVTGLNEEDFSSHAEYEKACKKIWTRKTDEEKIYIWGIINNREE